MHSSSVGCSSGLIQAANGQEPQCQVLCKGAVCSDGLLARPPELCQQRQLQVVLQMTGILLATQLVGHERPEGRGSDMP